MTGELVAALVTFTALTVLGFAVLAALFWATTPGRWRPFAARAANAVERAFTTPCPWRWQ